MAEIKAFKGGKKADDAELMCPHCNLVPFEQHPNFSCPRLACVDVSDGCPDSYAYVDPVTWHHFKRTYLKDD